MYTSVTGCELNGGDRDGLLSVNSQEERMGMTVVAIFRNVTKNSTGVAPPPQT